MITNDFIAKIEGHGSLSVNWKKADVKLRVHEGERLFEGILVGRTAEETHWITPRICGVCPIAHNLASLCAIEDALEIQILYEAKLLRRLMQAGQNIQSHVLHLFFLALPDYIGIVRGSELAQKKPDLFEKALSLKKLGDSIARFVAGRNVHPTTTCVGGFRTVPTKEELKELRKVLEQTRDAANWCVEYFTSLTYPDLDVDLELVAQVDGNIVCMSGESYPIKNYKKIIEEELRTGSTAKFGTFKGKEMFVGALARLAVLKRACEFKINVKNPFHNNLAQAVEILLFHQDALSDVEELFELNLERALAKKVFYKKSAKGIGAIEAPRGGLYHEISLDKKGIVVEANIITPTVQNLTSIEKSARALLAQNSGVLQKEKERLLNMLVRAYDPCITCSTH